MEVVNMSTIPFIHRNLLKELYPSGSISAIIQCDPNYTVLRQGRTPWSILELDDIIDDVCRDKHVVMADWYLPCYLNQYGNVPKSLGTHVISSNPFYTLRYPMGMGLRPYMTLESLLEALKGFNLVVLGSYDIVYDLIGLGKLDFAVVTRTNQTFDGDMRLNSNKLQGLYTYCEQKDTNSTTFLVSSRNDLDNLG